MQSIRALVKAGEAVVKKLGGDSVSEDDTGATTPCIPMELVEKMGIPLREELLCSSALLNKHRVTVRPIYDSRMGILC